MGLRNRWSIAWGIAKQAKDAGANLILTYQGEREEKNARKLSAQLGDAPYVKCDISVDEDIDALHDYLKEKNIEVHGVAHCIAHAKRHEMFSPFIETTREGFAHALDVSAYSLIAVCRALKPVMARGCSIITLSFRGAEAVIPGYNVMGVAKAALEASVRYLAVDLGADEIRINAISAGGIKTMSAGGIKNFDKLLDEAAVRTPIKKGLTPDDVGKSSVYLLSDLSSAVTGEVTYVDYGVNIMGM